MPAGHRKSAPTNDDSTNDASGSAASGVRGLAEEAMDRIGDVTASMADRGEEMLADAGETLRSAGRATTGYAGAMAERTRSAGIRAARGIEAELAARPWTVALAALAVAGVFGFIIGSRRHDRY